MWCNQYFDQGFEIERSIAQRFDITTSIAQRFDIATTNESSHIRFTIPARFDADAGKFYLVIFCFPFQYLG